MEHHIYNYGCLSWLTSWSLHFIVYINDIINADNLFKFVIHAYDKTLPTTLELVRANHDSSTNNNKIKYKLARISDLLKPNKLFLNVSKTRCMIFHTPQNIIHPLHFKINYTDIEQVFEFSFLGLSINENMNRKSHIDKISNKISRSMGILNEPKHFLPLNTKLMIYNFLILYRPNFGIQS